MKRLVLDLFSGTGSATQPFVECGKHRVVRIDIAGHPDVRADVRSLPIKAGVRPQFVWASPPCTEFSTLTQLAVIKGYRGPRDPAKGMILVRAAREFIEQVQPKYWAIENVRGAVKHIGRPRFLNGAWALWGNFPGFILPASNRLRKGRRGLAKEYVNSTGRRVRRFVDVHGMSTAERSMIHPRLAEAVHRAVCE